MRNYDGALPLWQSPCAEYPARVTNEDNETSTRDRIRLFSGRVPTQRQGEQVVRGEGVSSGSSKAARAQVHVFLAKARREHKRRCFLSVAPLCYIGFYATTSGLSCGPCVPTTTTATLAPPCRGYHSWRIWASRPPCLLSNAVRCVLELGHRYLHVPSSWGYLLTQVKRGESGLGKKKTFFSSKGVGHKCSDQPFYSIFKSTCLFNTHRNVSLLNYKNPQRRAPPLPTYLRECGTRDAENESRLPARLQPRRKRRSASSHESLAGIHLTP